MFTKCLKTRQQEKFIVLMENYGTALKYAETAAQSAGTATEKFGAYTESVEGKTNSLKASFEQFAMTFLSSDIIIGAVGFITWLIEALTVITEKIGGLNTILYTTAAIIAIIKADSIVTILTKIIGFFPMLIGKIGEFILTIKIARAEGMTMGASVSAAFDKIGVSASAAQIVVAAFVAVLSAAILIVNGIKSAQDKAVQSALSSANAYLTEAESAKEDADSLDALIKKYEELAQKNNDGTWDDQALETVKGIQDEIVKLVGDQGEAIDLVNGKLKEQLGILEGIADKSNEVALGAAQSALKDAEVAVQSAMGKWRTGDNQYFDIGTGGNKTYGRVKTETVTRSIMGAGNLKYDTIKTEFDTAKEFAEQYEAVLEYKDSVANTIDETNALEVEMYKEVNEFLKEFKDVYTAYKSAQDLVTQLTTPPETGNSGNVAEEIKGVTVALKSAYDILEEAQEGYNGLKEALEGVTAEGYLTAEALSSLYELSKDDALAGLDLSKIITQDANGYKLATDALQQYVDALINAYTIKNVVFASEEDRDNAIANLETLRSVLATLAQSEIEEHKKAFDEQLDNYKELIEIRKELLETYEKELSYQKELEKKQRNVASLQTRLAVAKLDDSASGQARVRELEAELQEAQEELDDFTLEHAIEVLTERLDAQYSEYEYFIKGKLDEITTLIAGISKPIADKIDEAISAVILYNEYGKEPPNTDTATGDTSTPSADNQTSSPIYTDNVLPNSFPQKPYSSPVEYRNAVKRMADELATKYNAEWVKQTPHYKSIMSPVSLEAARAAWDVMRRMYAEITGAFPNYHTGGFVGGTSKLRSNEEFAKLLKGEMVVTPEQMRRFMKDTLPQITTFGRSGNNEFNAPLIEINCESITSETLPSFRQVIDQAVTEIKKQFDDGMMRTGYKRQTVARLF